MAKIFAKQILRGAVAIEDVPERWRAQVEKILEEESDTITVTLIKPNSISSTEENI